MVRREGVDGEVQLVDAPVDRLESHHIPLPREHGVGEDPLPVTLPTEGDTMEIHIERDAQRVPQGGIGVGRRVTGCRTGAPEPRPDGEQKGGPDAEKLQLPASVPHLGQNIQLDSSSSPHSAQGFIPRLLPQ